MINKKQYVKPRVLDLGSVRIVSAQMPMGLCQTGNTASQGSAAKCETGGNVETTCGGGGTFSVSTDDCLAGGGATNMCYNGVGN